jgi:hypothetical protein
MGEAENEENLGEDDALVEKEAKFTNIADFRIS